MGTHENGLSAAVGRYRALQSGGSTAARTGTEPPTRFRWGLNRGSVLDAAHGGMARRLVEELARSRRYERPFALALLVPETEDNGSGDQRAQVSITALVSIVAACGRSTDIVGLHGDGDSVMLLMPETEHEEARRAVERLQLEYWSHAEQRIRAGTASFPEDGLTLEVLLEQAAATLDMSSPPARGEGAA